MSLPLSSIICGNTIGGTKTFYFFCTLFTDVIGSFKPCTLFCRSARPIFFWQFSLAAGATIESKASASAPVLPSLSRFALYFLFRFLFIEWIKLSARLRLEAEAPSLCWSWRNLSRLRW